MHTTSLMNDVEQWIRDAQSGDADAFEKLLEEHYDTIYRFAFRWCRDQQIAADIAQEVCIKLATSLPHFHFKSSFSSWLYRVVINCAKDWLRRENKHSLAEHTSPDNEISDTERAENDIYLSQLLGQMDHWGKDYRETAVLVIAEGLSHHEASIVLEVSESTVSWRIHDIRKRIAALEREILV